MTRVYLDGRNVQDAFSQTCYALAKHAAYMPCEALYDVLMATIEEYGINKYSKPVQVIRNGRRSHERRWYKNPPAEYIQYRLWMQSKEPISYKYYIGDVGANIAAGGDGYREHDGIPDNDYMSEMREMSRKELLAIVWSYIR